MDEKYSDSIIIFMQRDYIALKSVAQNCISFQRTVDERGKYIEYLLYSIPFTQKNTDWMVS